MTGQGADLAADGHGVPSRSPGRNEKDRAGSKTVKTAMGDRITSDKGAHE